MAFEEASNTLDFNVGNLINCVHYKDVIWIPSVNRSEEEQETHVAWRRFSECLGSATYRL